MRKKFWTSSNKANSLVLMCGIFFCCDLLAKNDLWMNYELTLDDGRKLVLNNVGDRACFELSLRSRVGSYLWDRTYCTDFDTLWYHPFFVPIKSEIYELDMNHDGKKEVGIAVWDGGNSSNQRWAIIFTVEKSSLKPYGMKLYDIERRGPLLP